MRLGCFAPQLNTPLSLANRCDRNAVLRGRVKDSVKVWQNSEQGEGTGNCVSSRVQQQGNKSAARAHARACRPHKQGLWAPPLCCQNPRRRPIRLSQSITSSCCPPAPRPARLRPVLQEAKAASLGRRPLDAWAEVARLLDIQEAPAALLQVRPEEARSAESH